MVDEKQTVLCFPLVTWTMLISWAHHFIMKWNFFFYISQ